MKLNRKDIARIFGRIALNRATKCWEWTGHRVFGYGSVRAHGKQRKVHRVVYEAFIGPVEVGLQLDHLCRNRACANPAHLEPVTPRENVMRGTGRTAVNARKTECQNGHPLTGRNVMMVAGSRICRTCHNAKSVVWRAAKRRASLTGEQK